jgi:CheY-like chemotaxis protein
MVDGLCAQSGGKLMLRSRLYQGTTIELWLPATSTEAAVRLPATVDSVSAIAADHRRLKVLLVDDDHLVLRSTTAMLEDCGHEVLGVSSGEGALDILRRRATHIDLVIADQVMPGMTGLQLARELRAMRPGLPVLLATGYGELPPGSEGILPRLTKPFTQQQLANAAEACMHPQCNTGPLDS